MQRVGSCAVPRKDSTLPSSPRVTSMLASASFRLPIGRSRTRPSDTEMPAPSGSTFRLFSNTDRTIPVAGSHVGVSAPRSMRSEQTPSSQASWWSITAASTGGSSAAWAVPAANDVSNSRAKSSGATILRNSMATLGFLSMRERINSCVSLGVNAGIQAPNSPAYRPPSLHFTRAKSVIPKYPTQARQTVFPLPR